ncbi:hypothetical protein L0Y69_02595, partial [bacterium]|nr:hypothetical protein [bacterium]
FIAMPPQKPNANTKRLKRIFALLSLLAIFFLGTSVYFFMKLKSSGVSADRQEEQALSEDMVGRVAAHIVLPEDEKPTVATVSDTAQLAGQAFFEKAKKGDIVLIYAKAHKAILYDPVADRIVEAAPLAIEAGE